MYRSKKNAIKAYKAYLYKTGKKWGDELDANMTLGEIQELIESIQSESELSLDLPESSEE